ncbi:hypothetical protein [Actinacidiphila soli]|uniref:hypothetical protein n=1 Tax=Actinacidiphila soli TaxID=2487275 RepID=UPI000FCA340D|nr:hypothetical protein [Actinacidiphila soli]
MPCSQAGVSAAIATTGRQIGNSLGVAVLGSIVSARGHGPIHGTLMAASHLGWWILTGCGVLIAILGILTAISRAAAGAARITARFATEPSPPSRERSAETPQR